ncbi:hypothetical protein LINGRAHAP2_LOCUS17372 [Linum grandiflorum]
MGKACLECGGEGFSVAFVHCRGCKLHVIHRYCLHPLPSLEECVLWFCEDCKPKFESLSQTKKHLILVKGSDYATLKKAPPSKKSRKPSSTKCDVLRIEIYSSPQNTKALRSKNSMEDAELLIQNEGNRSPQTGSAEVKRGCSETSDGSDQHQRKKRLKTDDEDEASLRKCNGLYKEARVEQAEPVFSSKQCVTINDNNEEREGQKRLQVDAETEAPLRVLQSPEVNCHKVEEKDKRLGRCSSMQEAMVEQDEPLTSEKRFVMCDSSGKHESRKRLREDDKHEVPPHDLQPLELDTCKVGEQDKELGNIDRPNEEMMIDQAQQLTTEDSSPTCKTNDKHERHNIVRKDNEHEASPCEPEPLQVSSSMAGGQDEELGRCNNMEENTMVELGEPLTGKDSQVGVSEMPLQTLVCEDMEMEHAVHNELNEGGQHNEADHNNSMNSQPYVPDAPVEPILNVCALPIKDPSWRGSLSIIDRVFGTSTQLVAHLSSLACARVTEATNSLPKLLSTELLPRLDVWPKGFQKCSPGGDSIALYFLPEAECDEKISNKLVQRMIDQDLGIKSVLEDAELLIFTSTVLPEEYRKFQEKEYLWGVFRGKQPSKVAGDVSNEKNPAEIQNTPSPVSPLS